MQFTRVLELRIGRDRGARGDIDHAGAMVQTPTRRRGNTVEIAHERDRVRRDISQRLNAAEHRVVEIDLHLARRLKAVCATRLQPIGTKRFDRIIHGRIMVLCQLVFGDRIPIGARASPALQVRAGDQKSDDGKSTKPARHTGIMLRILWLSKQAK